MSDQGPISSNSDALLELLQLSFAIVTTAMFLVLSLACLNLKARCDRLDEWAERVNVRLGVK